MRLYVGNIPYDMTEARIREVIGEFGEIVRVDMPTDRDTGRLRGFAFVEMPSDEQGSKAINQLDGVEVDGRKLVVNVARERERRGGGGGHDRGWHGDRGDRGRR